MQALMVSLLRRTAILGLMAFHAAEMETAMSKNWKQDLSTWGAR